MLLGHTVQGTDQRSALVSGPAIIRQDETLMILNLCVRDDD